MLYYQYIHRKTFINDVIILLIFNAIMFALFHYYDALEWLYQLSRDYEQYELDEVIALGASLTTSLLIFSYRRIHEISKVTQAFEELAMTDPLTNALNRRTGQLQLENWHQHAKTKLSSYALLQVNINQFRRINELYGSSIGDEVLIKIAKELNYALPENSKLIRWIDDNFLILLAQQPQSPFEIAEQIREKVDHTALPLSESITCRIGVAVFQPSLSVEDMLENVEDALLRAKISA